MAVRMWPHSGAHPPGIPLPHVDDGDRDFLTLDEVAYLTFLSRRAVEQAVASGALGSVKIGTRRLVPAPAYDSWVASVVTGVAS